MIKVKTNIGTLIARAMPDQDYPGIDIVLIPKGETYEVNIALVEVPHSEEDDHTNQVVTRVWASSECEDCTDFIVHT